LYLKELQVPHALTLSGETLCIFSLLGAFSSYLWGAISRRVNILWLLALGQLVSAATLYWFLHARTPTAIVALAVLAGFFAGGAFFPLVATLARHAVGLTPGLRAGLIIGGSWGIGSLGALCGAALLHFGWSNGRVLMLTVPFCVATGIIAIISNQYCQLRQRQEAWFSQTQGDQLSYTGGMKK
jgi:MFS family permease